MNDTYFSHETTLCQDSSGITFKVDELSAIPNSITSFYNPIKVTFAIEKVIFNDPATIVIWEDGSKTVVKAQNGEPFDKEKGLAMALLKFICGNNGSYNKVFKEWIED